MLLQGSAATQSSLFDPPSQPPDLSSQIADLAAWGPRGHQRPDGARRGLPREPAHCLRPPTARVRRGNLRPEDSRSVAVVGTRRPTDDGIIARAAHRPPPRRQRLHRRERSRHRHRHDCAHGRARSRRPDGRRHRHRPAARVPQAKNAAPPGGASPEEGAVVSQFLPDAPPTKSELPDAQRW